MPRRSIIPFDQDSIQVSPLGVAIPRTNFWGAQVILTERELHHVDMAFGRSYLSAVEEARRIIEEYMNRESADGPSVAPPGHWFDPTAARDMSIPTDPASSGIYALYGPGGLPHQSVSMDPFTSSRLWSDGGPNVYMPWDQVTDPRSGDLIVFDLAEAGSYVLSVDMGKHCYLSHANERDGYTGRRVDPWEDYYAYKVLRLKRFGIEEGESHTPRCRVMTEILKQNLIRPNFEFGPTINHSWLAVTGGPHLQRGALRVFTDFSRLMWHGTITPSYSQEHRMEFQRRLLKEHVLEINSLMGMKLLPDWPRRHWVPTRDELEEPA